MKRAHRKWHLAIWTVIGPAMLIVLALAVLQRPGEVVNEDLPDALIEEAA